MVMEEKKVFTSTKEVLETYMPKYAAEKGSCAKKQDQKKGPSIEGKGREFAEGIFEGMKQDLKQPQKPKKTLGKSFSSVWGSLFNSN